MDDPRIRNRILRARRELYGAGASAGPRVVAGRAPGRSAGYVDHRLRGLDPAQIGPTGGRTGYDVSSARYNIMNGDPYAQEAERQRELGRRMPGPWQAASALNGMPSVTGRAPGSDHAWEDLFSDEAVYSAGSVAGQRQTQWGTQGAITDGPDGGRWDARKRMGYGGTGQRDAGFFENDHSPLAQDRTAGKLSAAGAFDQEVNRDRPFLHIRAGGTSTQAEGEYSGNAIVRVIAGNFQHGASVRRTFLVGGGLEAWFDLQGWDSVRINVLQLVADTFVEFAWSQDGLPGDSSYLLFPQRYTTSALSEPVPDGAWGIVIENPIPAVAGTTVELQWISRLDGAAFTFTTQVSDNSPIAAPRPYVYFASPIQVWGTSFRVDTDVDLLWLLHPI